MKDVLLSNAGVQVYIIDGSRRTDAAARAVITALYNAGRVCKEAAERAMDDRPTLDKIKRIMIHCKMETRTTETGNRWTFYTKSGVFMDIPAYSENYITADADGNLYAAEAPTEPEAVTGEEVPTDTTEDRQRSTESAEKTTDDTTTAGSDADHTEATQTAEKTIRSGARLYSHPHRHMVTVDGMKDGLVIVVYRGRLYLVSSADLYTDETETTPAILPAETAITATAEAAQAAAVIPITDDTTSATKTPQEASQSATATTGRDCTQTAGNSTSHTRTRRTP